MIKHSPRARLWPRNLLGVVLIFASACTLRADIQIALVPPDPARPSVPRLDMQLINFAPRAVVPVQQKLLLTDPTWLPYDFVLTDSSGNGSCSFFADPTQPGGNEHFFRAVLPVPQINSLQPSVISSSGGVFFLVGQVFVAGDTVKIDGITVSSSFIDSNTFQVNAGALGAGYHTVTLVDSSNNILFSLTNGLFVTTTGRTDQESPPSAPLVDESLTYDGGPGAEPEESCGDKIRKYEWDLNYQTPLALPPVIVPPGFAAGSEIFTDKYSRIKVHFHWDREGKHDSDSSCWIRVQPSPGGTKLHPLFAVPRVNEATGELFVGSVDLVIPGRGLDLVWARTYRSKTGMDTPIGFGWDFSYNIRAAQSGTNITVQDGQNRIDPYFLQSDGSYSTDELFRRGTLSGNVFTLQFADKTTWLFKPLDGSATSGKIDKIIDRNSNQLQFFYNGAGQLNQIIDSLGRPFQIVYDAMGRIQLVQDFSGRQVVYTHHNGSGPGGSLGDLLAVRSPIVNGTPNGNDFPSGKTAQFTYSTGFADPARNHNLLTASDGNNVQWLQVIYTTGATPPAANSPGGSPTPTPPPTELTYDRVARTIVGTSGETTVYTYLPKTASFANRFNTTKTIVNDPLGNVHESLFDSKNRLIDLRRYTGRSLPGSPVTETVNRPTGQVRATDPAFYKTTFDWNRDSLATHVTWPRGNGFEMVYQRDFDPNVSPVERANLRVHREIPLSGPPIVQRLGHQPGFGTGEFLQFHFGTVFTTKIDWSGPGDEGPEESITFVYGKVGVQYTKQVNNDEAVMIRHDRTATVDKDEMITVHGSRTETVGKDDTVTVHMNRTETVGNDESITVQGSRTRTVGKDESISVQGNRTETVDRNEKITIHDFRTSYVDGRGFTWTCARDSNGNAIGLTRPDGVVTTYEYNANGQLTGHVMPPNSSAHSERDEWHYYSSGPQNGYLQSFVRDVGGLNLTTTYQYDAVGNLIQVTDPRGTPTQFAVNQLNQVVQTTYQSAAPGQTPVPYLRNTYYDANNRISHIDVENKDEFGNQVASNPFFTTTYVYDSLDHVTSLTREVDSSHTITTQYFYDASRNLTEVRSPLAVTSADPNARVQYVYDERNLIFTDTGAQGSNNPFRATYSYDGNGQLLERDTGAPGGAQHITTYSYDGFDRLITLTDPVGTISHYSYDANGNLIEKSVQGHLLDNSGNPIFGTLSDRIYIYDSKGTLTQLRDTWFDPISAGSLGDGLRTTSITRDPALNVTGITDDNSHTTVYSYDGANRLSRVTDPKNNRVDYTYDADGNLTVQSRTDKSDLALPDQTFTTTYTYDGLNRTSTTVDNVGNLQTYFYDSRGDLVRYFDARGNLSQYEYDGLGRITRSGQDLGGNSSAFDGGDIVTVYTYDDNSRLVGQTDPNLHATQYQYDSFGRLVQKTNADGTTSSRSYDAWGNVVQSTDENGTGATYTYDNLNRLTQRQIQFPVGSQVSQSTTFEIYDYPGSYLMPLRAIDDAVPTRFTYDSLGRLISERSGNLTTTYTYDGAGNLLTLQSPGGRTLSYTYDAANLPTGVSLTTTSDGDSLGQIAVYEYVGVRLQLAGHRNGTSTFYTYDGFVGAPASADLGWGKVSGSQTQGPGSTLLDQRTYTYDADGNLSERRDTRPGTPQLLYHYDYDRANRNTHTQVSAGASTLRNTTYVYDATGNRVSVNGPGTPDPGTYTQNAATPVPADAQMNQYTTTPLGNYLYDANGNRTNLNGSGVTYTYDYSNRLIDLSKNGVRSATYQYDALGRRTQKILDPDSTPLATNYIYSGKAVLEERDSGNVVVASYSSDLPPKEEVTFWGNINSTDRGEMCDDNCSGRDYCVQYRESDFNFASRLMEEEGIYYYFSHSHGMGANRMKFFFSEPVEMRRGGVNYTYHAEVVPWLWLMTNAAGSAAERYDYEDFGDPHVFNGAGGPLATTAIGNPYLFKGMRFDGESALYIWSFGAGPRQTIDLAASFMFDPKIGASLQRESSHATNAWRTDTMNPSSFIQNSHTGAFDISVFGFEPQPLKAAPQ